MSKTYHEERLKTGEAYLMCNECGYKEPFQYDYN